MRKAHLTTVFISALLASQIVFAEDAGKTCFSAVNWVSKSQSDAITIQNGSGSPILVVITVDKQSPAGLGVNNCNGVSHIDPDGTAICAASDPTAPVSFKSDSANNPANGTYQIKEQ